MGDIRARLTSLSLSLPLLAVVSLAAGCGDNTPSSQTGTGGTSVTGTGGSTGGAGGMSTGGAGGVGTGGAGGLSTGGTGGVGTGGAGGVGTGGAGGVGTGGTGGVGTGGTGGVGTGGTGGVGTGGAGGGPPACYTTAFTAPASGATLTVTDDGNHTCADGFQYTVTITSGAPDGTDVTLYDGSTLLKTVKVSGGAASFAVQLSTAGAQQLSIQYPSTQTCNVTENVTVSCPNSPPTCTISKPVISATHPELNGVPTAQNGDRSSSAGSPYQATFVVNTNAEDGQAVTLAVNSEATNPPTAVDGTPTANVSGGSATFGLTLVPDGTYDVTATCVNKNGITGTSTKSTFTVDTTPPDLTVTSPSAGMFVVGGTVRACAETDSSDAASLAGSLGAGQRNLCVTLGSSATPTCVAVAAINTPTCVNFICPGSSAFSLTYTLSDAAGNPMTQTVTGVTCASALPSVQIVAPVSDAPSFTDKSKHILAANAPIGVKDEDPSTIGAQADVVACTDTVGTATLFVGHQGDSSLVQLGTALTTVAATGQCPSGLGNVAVFAGVTLPESNEKADGTLLAATELQVSVTSATNSADTGTSLVDDVWVDSQVPNLALLAPNGLCGSFTQSAATVTEDVAYTADDTLVVLDLTNNGTTTTYDVPAYVNGVATFGSVAFPEGQNNLVATESDPAGNATVLPACLVTVGMAPVVTFTTPTAGALLCPSGDATTGCIDDNDTGTAGWQGTLTVNVKAGGTNVVGSVVTFTDGATTFGMATTDANGNVTLTAVTVAEGSQTIVATTDNVPGAGIGSGSVNVTVDTAAPNVPGAPLLATVTDRRKTSMQLTWTAPSDGGGGDVTSYFVRYSKTPIVTAADFAAATDVPYGGQPAHAGQLDGIGVSPLYIENNYYFAVEGVNAVGTVGPMLATPGTGTCDCMQGRCCAAHFNETTLSGTSGLSNELFGSQLDGTGDVDGDGKSDILAAASNGQRAYLFLGASGSFAPATPSVTFSGDGTTTGFGRGVAAIGDVDNDGREDIAISDPGATVPRVFIYKGRAVWPATMTPSDANYVISGDSTYNGSSMGTSIARLGDFNGDGVDDFAIGVSGFGSFVGRVVIVLGKTGFGSVALPDTANSITIDGDSTLSFPLFGARVLGLGHLYSVSNGTTLIVSESGVAGTSSSQGHVYSFHGQSGTGGSIALSSADGVLAGPAANADIGNIVVNLGPMLGSFPSLGIGNPADSATGPNKNGSVYVLASDSTAGPFGGNTQLLRAGVARDGQVVLGGGISGRNISFSMIGGSTPDLIVVPQSANGIQIVDGSIVAGLGAGSTDLSADATVTIAQPGWNGTGTNDGTVIPDVNGDGYPDFALGNAVGAVAGQVNVYW